MSALVAGETRTVLNVPAPQDTLFHVLSFVPGTTPALRATSRALYQIAADFLKWSKGEIYRTLRHPDVHPLLHRGIHQSCPHGMIGAYQDDLVFHRSVQREMRALGASWEDCPDAVVAPQEISCFNSQVQKIQDFGLQRIWERVREEIVKGNPLLVGVPGSGASAEQMRVWMHAHRTVLGEIAELRLNDLDLTCVPVEIGLCTGLQVLNLGYNRLAFLQEDFFQTLTQLQRIHLYNNRLISIPENLLRGLTRLRWFNCDNNRLISLPEGLFRGLSRLEWLDFENNQLATLPGGIFHGLIHLVRLDLDSNRLTSFPEELFQGALELSTLYFDDNQLVSLPEGLFQGLSGLQCIFSSNNQLSSLPERLFQGLSSLLWIDCECNHLVSLPGGLFHGLHQLNRLDFSNNRLVSLPEGLFREQLHLETLRLHGNPHLFVSGQDLPDYQNNIAFKRVMRDFFGYRCRSPLASLYQLVAGGCAPEVVRERCAGFGDAVKNALFLRVWKEAGRPATNDVRWGEHHAGEEMPVFQRALKRYVTDSFKALDADAKYAVYARVAQLAQSDGIPSDAPNWGEQHAWDNLLRLIDAMPWPILESFPV